VMIRGDERDTVLSLAQSPHVAAMVLEQLDGRLKPEEANTHSILDMVETRARGTFLDVSVRNNDPAIAAAIADSWAECYIRYSNDFLATLQGFPEELEYSVNTAREAYERELNAYEDFRKISRINELTRLIPAKESLYSAMLLREQIQGGYTSEISSKANSLVFALLLVDAYTNGSSASTQLSLDSATGETVSLEDVDNLISVIEAGAGKANDKSPAELQHEIAELQIELANEDNMLAELKQSVDVAWASYITSVQTVSELEVTSYTERTEVVLVESASTSGRAVGPRRLTNIGIALVLGVVVGIFGAFGAEYFGKAAKRDGNIKKEG
jgi:capsular polysaccharide biosynthesis protein